MERRRPRHQHPDPESKKKSMRHSSRTDRHGQPVITPTLSRQTVIRAALGGVIAVGLSGDSGRNIHEMTLIEGPPSQEQIQNAIQRGDAFITGLLKPITPQRETISEYYGLPLRIEDQTGRFWLAGREGDHSKITNTRNEHDFEEHTITFPGHVINASIFWNVDPKHYDIFLTNEGAQTPSRIYLGQRYIGEFNPGYPTETFKLRFKKNDRSPLQSLRYTDRHGTQTGLSWAKNKGDTSLADKFTQELISKGYHPGLDLHAPIWNDGAQYPDDFPKNGDVFHDCAIPPTTTNTSYIYQSKVCKELPLYRELAQSDILLPLTTALHSLKKYYNPSKTMTDGSTPMTIAEQTLAIFKRYGEAGIVKSTVGGFSSDTISSFRTVQFGTLLTELGYVYGIEKYKKYADRIAQLTIHNQIKDDGIVHTTDGDFYRPLFIGGFPLAWTTELTQELKQPTYYKAIATLLDAEPEYGGVIPSNTETTMDTLAFLHRYQQAVYPQ